MSMKNFITFEGGECSGKTTIISAIVKKFEELNIDFITTREPGGIRIAEEIRNIILDVKNTDMTPECEALLYAASRMQHLSQKVIPAINEGKVVLCDRFLDSSLAYQGCARGLGIDNILKAFGSFQHVIRATTEELDDVEGIGEVRAKNIKQGIKRMHEQAIYDSKFYR